METPANENHGHGGHGDTEQNEAAQNPTNQETSSYDGKLVAAILIAAVIIVGILIYKFVDFSSKDNKHHTALRAVGERVEIPASSGGKNVMFTYTVDVDIFTSCGEGPIFGDATAKVCPYVSANNCSDRNSMTITFVSRGTLGGQAITNPTGEIIWWYE